MNGRKPTYKNTWLKIKKEKEIRCKCGKQWGVEKFRAQTTCRRCKTEVIARGDR